MAYAFDPKSGRYRDTTTGRWLSRDAVIDMAGKSLAASANAADELAALVSSGALTPADFGLLARTEIKNEYITQYLLGIGGREQMTPSDWGTIGRMLRDQYHPYLDGFIQDIADGKLTEAQIQARFRMYIDSAHQAYEKAAQKTARKAGFTEERWILDAEAEHCDDCVAYAGQEWQPIGTFPDPGDGSTTCLTNCRCYKIFRNPATGETY